MSDGVELKPGLKGKAELVVADEHLASAVGSGLVPVFSTPMLIALLENAAVDALRPVLSEGQTSVGTRLDVRHLAPTPPGMRVRAHAELAGVEGRLLTFHVWAEDDSEKIGEGLHERAIIDRARFDKRVREKAAGAQPPDAR
jgi:predicted thioesterase